jgi:CelD/BcsL family acetyltransferase involved in cellulose biosynthesis
MDVTLHQDQIGELLPEWAELFAVDDRATPFQSPGWARAWWKYWAGGSKPWLLAVRDAGRLVGLAPLCSDSVLGLRRLRVNGEPADYWEVLALPEHRPAVEETLGGELQRRQRDWDLLVLGQLPHGSSTAARLQRAGLRTAHRSEVACPAIDLPESFDAYLATLPSSRRTNLRRRLRNLDGGKLELRVPAVEDLPEAIDRWQALRQRQWAAMGKRLNPEHSGSRFRDFLLDVTTDLVPAGLALMWEFVHEGDVVGSFVNFCDGRAFYQYLGGFAPELGSLAIGKVATAEGIRASIAAGRSSYDFMRGDEEYKYWYGAENRPSPSVVLTSDRARSVFAGRLGALIPPLRS